MIPKELQDKIAANFQEGTIRDTAIEGASLAIEYISNQQPYGYMGNESRIVIYPKLYEDSVNSRDDIDASSYTPLYAHPPLSLDTVPKEDYRKLVQALKSIAESPFSYWQSVEIASTALLTATKHT